MEIGDLAQIKHVHFIGIGGIGISAIARMMIHDGKRVTGQDLQDSDIIFELKKLGAEISIGQSFQAIPNDCNLIVYTIAVETYDPKLFSQIKDPAMKVPALSYPEMLHVVTSGKYTIAVAGTHGKTTTTGMITQILRDAGKDPTVIIGSLLIGEKSNFIAGKSEYFVVEACEYRRSFLNINPTILVITNIDADHLDYYKDINDIKNAFQELVMKVPASGVIVCNPSDPNIDEVVSGAQATVANYKKFFDLNMKLKIPGLHNKKNAAAASAVTQILGVSASQAKDSLSKFPGTWRRFEFKGTLPSGALVYDDYAHHPAEIKATLQGFRELYPKSAGWKLTVLFQPHLFSRTKAMLEEFSESFGDSNTAIILPIYYAREKDDGSVSSRMLSEKIIGPQSQAFHDFETAEQYIRGLTLGPKDIIITMGAGVAFKIGDNLLKK